SVHSKWRQTSPNPSRTGAPPVLLVSTFRESRKRPDRTEKSPSPGGASPSLGRGANIGERFSFYPGLAESNALNPLTRGRRKDETGSGDQPWNQYLTFHFPRSPTRNPNARGVSSLSKCPCGGF